MAFLYLWSVFKYWNGEFWIELNHMGNLAKGAWCIRGDFNEVLYRMDKNGRTGSTSQITNFNNWVSDFALLDIPLQNIQYTWSNFRFNATYSRLDRFFVNQQWLEKFSGASLRGLPRSLSNHCPLLFGTDKQKDGLSPFRFESMWLQHNNYKALVKSWWAPESKGRWVGLRSHRN